MHALLLSFGVIFVAELGDKSQLMATALAARYRAAPVLAGLTVATTLVHLISVGVGATVGANLPPAAVNVAAGVAFLGFGAWTLRGERLGPGEAERATRPAGSVFRTAGVAFFLAELGDKTMLATITLASAEGWVGTWIGSTLGMVAADTLAVAVGGVVGRRLPARVVRYGAATLFALFGVLLIVDGLTG